MTVTREEFDQLAAQVADHETRITALEGGEPPDPPPKPTTTTLDVGIWNCKVNRDADDVASFVRDKIFGEWGCDVALLCEAHAYRSALSGLNGLRLIAASGWDQAGESPIICDKALVVEGITSIRCTKTWIGQQTGNKHPPRTINLATIQGIRFASAHGPPNCSWDDGVIDANYNDVVEAYKEFANKLSGNMSSHWGNHPEQPWIGGGDMNAKPSAEGKYSPAWMMGQSAAAGWNTTHTGIDFLMRRAVTVSQVKTRGSGGSDHDAKTCRVQT